MSVLDIDFENLIITANFFFGSANGDTTSSARHEHFEGDFNQRNHNHEPDF